jgi:fumarylacetoacetate (FAA) hydrolase
MIFNGSLRSWQLEYHFNFRYDAYTIREKTMKLATIRNGSRDGSLVVVNKDHTTAAPIPGVATMQQLLDNWSKCSAAALAVSKDLAAGTAEDTILFSEGNCESPLPRAFQWADGSAYLNHVRLVRKARGAEMPESFLTDPLMYQGGSDTFLGPRDAVPFASESYGADMEAEVAVIVDDTPMGVSADDALGYIRLVMIVNDVSLRGLIPNELAKGFGFFHGKPSSAFSPLAVTLDELGSNWKEGKLHLPLVTKLNGKVIGKPNAGVDMNFHFGELIAHAAATRSLSAGTIIGSGTVSNEDPETGVSCLAELRMIETIDTGKPTTPFLSFGDRVEIEMFDNSGNSIFGRIDQLFVKAEG